MVGVQAMWESDGGCHVQREYGMTLAKKEGVQREYGLTRAACRHGERCEGTGQQRSRMTPVTPPSRHRAQPIPHAAKGGVSGAGFVGHMACNLEADPEGSSEVAFTYRDDGWFQMQQRLRPGPVAIRFRNETSRVVVAVIEQEPWDPRAITAAQVLSLPDFREVAGVEARTAPQEPAQKYLSGGERGRGT